MNEDERLENETLVAEGLTGEDLDSGVMNFESTPTPQGFPAAYGSKFGKSTVDLSIQDNEDKMLDEHRQWFMTGKDEDLSFTTRDKLRDDWYQKYHGMSHEEYKAIPKNKGVIQKLHDMTGRGGLALPALAMTDFVMDAVGIIPGLEKVDDIYDAETRLDSPGHQKFREILSIFLPGVLSGGKSMKITGASKLAQGTRWSLPWFKRMGAAAGVNVLADTAIVGISDTSEQETMSQTLARFIPGAFGPQGVLPIPEILKVRDSDSPAVRRMRTMLDNLPIPLAGSVIGSMFDVLPKNRKVMDWFEPLDEVAGQYKQLNIAMGGDPDKLIRLAEINEALSIGSKNMSKQVENALINEKLNLEAVLGNIDEFDDVVRRADISEATEQSARAANKLDNVDQLELDLGIDPDLSPGAFDDGAKSSTSVPPGNVARNMADTAAIREGVSQGDPAPIITDSMLRKGLMVGPRSRDAVMGVAEATRDAGRFNAVVDGFRFSAKQMNAAAWGIYNDIITAGSVDDVRELFLTNRDVKNLLQGKLKVEYISEDTARAAAFALRDLTDRFLGRPVTEASARAMDSIGREAATLAQAATEFEGVANDSKLMDVILDKMEFLLDEYGLNKYISGWALRNKNWFDQVEPRNIKQAVDNLLSEFNTGQNAIHVKNKKFVKELKTLKKNNPEVLRPLMDAFAHTNGDVDSQAKLMKWAYNQITPTGLIKSPDPKNMNLMAKGFWAVRYNNALSGLSPLRAAVGNGYHLVMKPIWQLLGHGFYGFGDGFEGFKRTLYYHNAVQETNRRALKDAYEMMKKAHKDPDMMIRAYRKDFVFKTDKTWEIMEGMRPVYQKQGNKGMEILLDTAIGLKQLGAHPHLRYGMTAMVFPDVFATTHQATHISRVKAYDDVFSDKGFADFKAIATAEKKHYDTIFDADGLLRDPVVRAFAGEIQLNLDDGVAAYINEATTAYPILKEVLMFPRTMSNSMKVAASSTPISMIPGISKYSKTIYAKTDADIAEALLEHGIIMAKTPNAKVIWENLRAEYTGRLIFSGLLVSTLWGHAMDGGIIGSGNYNAAARNRDRAAGANPYTLRVNMLGRGPENDVYVYYGDIPGVKQVLGALGDLAYYIDSIDEALLESVQNKLTWAISASFLQDAPLQGLEPLLAFINGDLSGGPQQLANSLRGMILQSGTLGVISNAITSSLKDIHTNDVRGMIMNRIPGLSSMLPEQIDIWTGDAINDIKNPFNKVLNALSPIKVKAGNEPWRRELQQIGFNGLSMLKKDSTGSYEYTPEEREIIYRYIGEQKMYKQLQRIFKTKRYQDELAAIRQHRRSGKTSDLIQIDVDDLPVMQDIRNVVRNAQKIAEIRFLRERPDIARVIVHQQAATDAMKKGNVERAITIRENNTRKILNMRK